MILASTIETVEKFTTVQNVWEAISQQARCGSGRVRQAKIKRYRTHGEKVVHKYSSSADYGVKPPHLNETRLMTCVPVQVQLYFYAWMLDGNGLRLNLNKVTCHVMIGRQMACAKAREINTLSCPPWNSATVHELRVSNKYRMSFVFWMNWVLKLYPCEYTTAVLYGWLFVT